MLCRVCVLLFEYAASVLQWLDVVVMEFLDI